MASKALFGTSDMTLEASTLWTKASAVNRMNIRRIAEQVAAEMGLTLPKRTYPSKREQPHEQS